jgi:hypothetical protein
MPGKQRKGKDPEEKMLDFCDAQDERMRWKAPRQTARGGALSWRLISVA